MIGIMCILALTNIELCCVVLAINRVARALEKSDE